MTIYKNKWGTVAIIAVIVATLPIARLVAQDKDPLPPRLPQDQRENLQRFLKEHEKPARYVPADGKLIDAPPSSVDTKVESTPAKPIKQYMVQIISQRPVPGEESAQRVDVYYYRPNPVKGKPGITIRHTVDLTTGKQIGATEVYVKRHTPLSQEELKEAVDLAKDKSAPVAELYKGPAKNTLRWEYLQMLVSRKSEPHEPGDRVVRLVFMAGDANDTTVPEPIRVVVNLTKGVVVPDAR